MWHAPPRSRKDRAHTPYFDTRYPACYTFPMPAHPKPRRKDYRDRRSVPESPRIRLLSWAVVAVAVLFVARLGHLQILQRSVYEALASGQRELYRELFPERGDIIVIDRDGTEVPLATNQFLNLVWAEPRRIDDPIRTAQVLSEILEREDVEQASASFPNVGEVSESDEDGGDAPGDAEATGNSPLATSSYADILAKLQKPDDPYEPIRRRVSDETSAEVERANLPGIHLLREEFRFYPEQDIAAHITGFVSEDDEGAMSGKYGVEGHYDDVLRGTPGFVFSELDAKGRWISVGIRRRNPVEDGAAVVLTIDRTIQHVACKALEEAVEVHQADAGSLVILNPKTGAIMAMCGAPSFNPNAYGNVESLAVYNNQPTFNAYEPGSVVKPLVMAGALDAGAVTPNTTYNDTAEVQIDRFTIRNSDKQGHGIQTMTQVLERSLNIGMIFVMRQMGGEKLTEYIHRFGFGEATGVEVALEAAGDVSSLENGHEVYWATASYGQGVTMTLMQLAAAYGALANNGAMMKPHVVQEVRFANGTMDVTEPETVRQVVSSHTAQLTTAMLVSVVEHGHAKGAQVPGYYMAGKTGTAQVANDEGQGYKQDETRVTFAGYGPARDPQFVVAIRMDHPRTTPWAEGTVVPMFGTIADFLVDYLAIPPER